MYSFFRFSFHFIVSSCIFVIWTHFVIVIASTVLHAIPSNTFMEIWASHLPFPIFYSHIASCLCSLALFDPLFCSTLIISTLKSQAISKKLVFSPSLWSDYFSSHFLGSWLTFCKSWLLLGHMIECGFMPMYKWIHLYILHGKFHCYQEIVSFILTVLSWNHKYWLMFLKMSIWKDAQYPRRYHMKQGRGICLVSKDSIWFYKKHWNGKKTLCKLKILYTSFFIFVENDIE